MNTDDASQAGDVASQAQDDLFSVIGAADLPDDEKAQLLSDMMNLVQDRVLVRVVDMITDEERDELEKIVDGEDSDQLESFLAEKVPNFEQIFLDEAKKLRQELIIQFSK